jgi:hypothetical protein
VIHKISHSPKLSRADKIAEVMDFEALLARLLLAVNFFLRGFRHTFAANQLRNGVNICAVQIRHRNIKLTIVFLEARVQCRVGKKTILAP